LNEIAESWQELLEKVAGHETRDVRNHAELDRGNAE
jgi:hypothetical protein